MSTTAISENELPPPAAPDDPRISVHVLGEFAFCRRAGLLSHEMGQAEPNWQDDTPEHLDYLPRYDLIEINRRLQESIRAAWRWLALFVIASVLSALFVYRVGWDYRWIAIAVIAIFAAMLLRAMVPVAVLARRLALADRATPQEPDERSPEDEPVGWWDIREAGFEAMRYHDPLEDELCKLTGRPWKVLRRGSTVIPVFQRPGDGPLREAHRIKIAAYCHLLQFGEGSHSPYGLVLDRDRYNATAVKLTRERVATFHQSLLVARNQIKEARESNTSPPPPDRTQICSCCPLGRPVAHRGEATETQINGSSLPVIGSTGADGRTYHSPCGDRYRWRPPHEKAIEKGLRRPVSES